MVEFGQTLKTEFMASMLGKEIGAGIARSVFISDLDPTVVIKVENNKCSFQNVIEWETWKRFERDKKVSRWLAPCVWISQSGGILMMKKTEVATKYPDRMPRFLGDFKRANYGMYKGRFVCHDYGTNMLQYHGDKIVLRKAEWWDRA